LPGFLRTRTRLLVLIDGAIQQTTIQNQITATPDRSDITIPHRFHHLPTSLQMRNSKRWATRAGRFARMLDGVGEAL
jgi:hypothetical protein